MPLSIMPVHALPLYIFSRMFIYLCMYIKCDIRHHTVHIVKVLGFLSQFFQAQTAADRRSLYFNVITSNSEQVLTVEGGGVNATVVQADIAATDGVIHIIDKVLGVPHTTVLDKLRTDPMLK